MIRSNSLKAFLHLHHLEAAVKFLEAAKALILLSSMTTLVGTPLYSVRLQSLAQGAEGSQSTSSAWGPSRIGGLMLSMSRGRQVRSPGTNGDET